MTNEQIIKTLRCCASPVVICRMCPLPQDVKDSCECGTVIAKKALNLIHRQQAEIERLQSGWISVEEKLPDADTRVLVYLDTSTADRNIYTDCDTDRIMGGNWVRWRGYVTHWMPLPNPPKVVEE